MDAGGDRRLGAGDVRGDGAAAERKSSARRSGRTTSASASSSACRPARYPAATASSTPGGRSGSTRPTCTRPRTRWRWRRWSPSSSRCRCRRAPTSRPRTSIIKGTLPPRVRRDLRHPLEPRPRDRLPLRHRRPPPRPPRLPPPHAPRPQRRLLRRRHPAGAPPRRHPDAGAGRDWNLTVQSHIYVTLRATLSTNTFSVLPLLSSGGSPRRWTPAPSLAAGEERVRFPPGRYTRRARLGATDSADFPRFRKRPAPAGRLHLWKGFPQRGRMR